MKKIKKSPNPPIELSEYQSKHPVGDPQHTWEAFCDDVKAKKVVQRQLNHDQRGLCAYCEIRLAESSVKVEHFHPKSDSSDSTRSWALDWNNLFLCCMGGERQEAVPEGDPCQDRFIAERRYRHCDVPKKDKILDDAILNPLEIPAFPSLFREVAKDRQDELDEYDPSHLELKPDKAACDSVSHDYYARAKNTIRELHLNSPILAAMRHEAIVAIEDAIRTRCLAFHIEPKEACKSVFAGLFRANADKMPAFFTAIRAHFGEIVEKRLREIGYDG